MGKGIIAAVAAALCFACPVVRAETIVFTSQSEWRSAVAEIALSLTPQQVPTSGGTIVEMR